MSKTGFKTREQIEFAEWFERVEKLGYKRADVARELGITRPAITNYLKGTSNPSGRSVAGIRAFAERIEQAKAQGAVLEQKFGSLDRLKEQLEFLEKNDPPSFAAARATIDALHRGVSSKPLSADEERAFSGAAAAQRLARGSKPKQTTVSPSENKPSPKPDAGERPK